MNTTDTTTHRAPLIDFDNSNPPATATPNLMRELMDMYFGQADEIMAGLKKAVRRAIVPDVDHLAHKLAGSSLACGMSAIVPPLRQMETGAKAGHLDGAEEFVGRGRRSP